MITVARREKTEKKEARESYASSDCESIEVSALRSLSALASNTSSTRKQVNTSSTLTSHTTGGQRHCINRRRIATARISSCPTAAP